MAKYSNTVEYNIKTTLDASGITKLQSELSKVQTTLTNLTSSSGRMKKLGLNIDEVELYKTQIEGLSKAITECFNSRTGMLNINKFNSSLKNSALDVKDLNNAFWSSQRFRDLIPRQREVHLQYDCKALFLRLTVVYVE